MAKKIMMKKRVDDNIITYNLIQTGIVCPEQYDVYNSDGRPCGYIRLRHGVLTCQYPDACGDYIFKHKFKNPNKACFYNTRERKVFLKKCLNAIYDIEYGMIDIDIPEVDMKVTGEKTLASLHKNDNDLIAGIQEYIQARKEALMELEAIKIEEDYYDYVYLNEKFKQTVLEELCNTIIKAIQ